MNRIKKDILERIKSGKVKMKPKWWFVGKEVGREGVWWGMVLMAAGGAAAMVYFGQLYDLGMVREYGELGWGVWMAEFPYQWLMATVAGIGGGSVWLSKIGENYRRAALPIWITTITAVGILTIALMWFQGLL